MASSDDLPLPLTPLTSSGLLPEPARWASNVYVGEGREEGVEREPNITRLKTTSVGTRSETELRVLNGFAGYRPLPVSANEISRKEPKETPRERGRTFSESGRERSITILHKTSYGTRSETELRVLKGFVAFRLLHVAKP